MNKVVTAKGIGVDSGMILISDRDYYGEKDELDFGKFQKSFNLKRGIYKINWKIEGTWNGDVCGSGIISITSGKLIVSDPCYIIEDDNKWSEFCKEALEKRYVENAILLDTMGGDGIYNVEIAIESVPEIEELI